MRWADALRYSPACVNEALCKWFSLEEVTRLQCDLEGLTADPQEKHMLTGSYVHLTFALCTSAKKMVVVVEVW